MARADLICSPAFKTECALWRDRGFLDRVVQMAFIEAPIQGSVSPNDVWFEYQVQSVEGGFTRPEVCHYVLKKGKLERVDPVALGPQDFAAFWLRHPW